MTNNIVTFQKEHARAVSQLHCEGIKGGFLSRLGIPFLKELYCGIGISPFSRVFVSINKKDSAVNGFVSCSLNTKAMYRHILLKKGLLFVVLLLPRVFNFKNLKSIFETLVYPLTIGSNKKKTIDDSGKTRKSQGIAQKQKITHAELLSIVVADSCRGKGVGRQLLNAMEVYFKENHIKNFTVVTDATDKRSNAFYNGCEFVFSKQFVHHGNAMIEYMKAIDK